MRCRNTRYLSFVPWLSIAVAIAPGFVSVLSSSLAGQAIAQARAPDSFTGAAGADSRSPVAATAPKKSPGSKEASRHKIEHGFTPEREAAALTFVKEASVIHSKCRTLETTLRLILATSP